MTEPWVRAGLRVRPVLDAVRPGDLVAAAGGEPAEPVPMAEAAAWDGARLAQACPADGGVAGDRAAAGVAEIAGVAGVAGIAEAAEAAEAALGPGRPVALVGGTAAQRTAVAERVTARHRARGGAVWWIDAPDEATVDAGLIRLAHALGGPRLAGQPVSAVRALAAEWLRTHEGWLLVLDGLAHPACAQGLPGRFPTGRVLATGPAQPDWAEYGAYTTVASGALADPQALIAAAGDPASLYGALGEFEAWLAGTAGAPRPAEQAAEVALAAGRALARFGDHGRAVGYLWRAAVEFGPHAPRALAARNELGLSLLGAGRPDCAAAVLGEVLRAAEAAAAPDPETVAAARGNLAGAHLQHAHAAMNGATGEALVDDARSSRTSAIGLARTILARLDRAGAAGPAVWPTRDLLARALLCRHRPYSEPPGADREALELLLRTARERAEAEGPHSGPALFARLNLAAGCAAADAGLVAELCEPGRPVHGSYPHLADEMVRSAYEEAVTQGGADCAAAELALEIRFAGITQGDFDEGSIAAGRAWLDCARRVYGIGHPSAVAGALEVWYEADQAPDCAAADAIDAQRRADAVRELGTDPFPADGSAATGLGRLAVGDVAGALASLEPALTGGVAEVAVDPAAARALPTARAVEAAFPALALGPETWRALEAALDRSDLPGRGLDPIWRARAARRLAEARELLGGLRESR